MRILTPLLIVILWLVLLLTGALKADDIIEYDADGNPIESTEIPADQIPEDTGFVAIDRPIVGIPQVAMPVVHIPAVNKTVVVPPEIRKMLYDNHSHNIAYNAVFLPDAQEPQPSLLKMIAMAFGYTPTVDSDTKIETYKHKDYSLKDVIKDVEAGIPAQMEFIKTDHPKNFVGDKRTLAHMPTVRKSKLWTKWKNIYEAEYPPIAYVPIADIRKIKMIAEMRVAESNSAYDNLVAELKYFRTLNYNTVLAVWEGDKLSKLMQQIALAKSLGYKVFFSYGKREKLHDAVFIDPDEYKQGLMRLSRECDGYLIGWRRTSLHLFKQDKPWVDYSLQCVRAGNPQIPVFGECYYGFQGNNNADGSYFEDEFSVNVPANASAAIVVNLGFLGVRPEGVLKLVRAETSVPLINLIVGDRPYYMTRNRNRLNKEQNRQVISSIENRFRRHDFGTSTLSGDGSNEIYDKSVSDDLCKSQWSK